MLHALTTGLLCIVRAADADLWNHLWHGSGALVEEGQVGVCGIVRDAGRLQVDTDLGWT